VEKVRYDFILAAKSQQASFIQIWAWFKNRSFRVTLEVAETYPILTGQIINFQISEKSLC
jgi:hypothetical protein